MFSPFRNIRTTALVLAAVAMVSLPSLPAKTFQPMQIAQVVDGGQPDPSQQGVYVKDSAIAADKFELGKKMERLKEWPKSADIYQEILEKYKDRVVPVAFNDKQQATKYSSVCEAVRARLAKWPAEGLTAYRNRFEPKAAELLDQAKRDDAAALHEVYDRYFVTESARKAGLQLIDLYMEMGEFAGAAQVGERLIEMHPSLGDDEALLLFSTASAFHLSGNHTTATHYAQDLQKRFAQSTATIGGSQVKLAEALAKAIESPAAVATSSSSDGYPMIGGDASRTALSAASAAPSSRVALVQIPAPTITAPNEQLRNQAQAFFEDSRNKGLATSVMPVVDRGELFFQNGQRLWAVHLESGVPLAGWQQTYSGRSGQFVLGQSIVANQIGEPWNSMQFSNPRQYSVTVTDDAVLAVMGMPDQRMMMAMFGGVPQANNDAGTRLVCLDRVTGRLRWTASPTDIPNNSGNAKNISFSGSPLVVGDNVYVIGRGSTGAGVEDCHVFCYDLAPGRPAGRMRWSCYIASSQNGAAGFGMPMMNPETLSHLAFAGGKIFVCTNLGAVAAIDAYSGATAWLVLYSRDPLATSTRMNQRMIWGGGGGFNPTIANKDDPRPWEFNPVMVSDGRLFVLPCDGKYLTIYDAATGEELKQIPRKLEIKLDKPERLDMLLAVNGKVLAVATDKTAALLDWTRAAVEKNNSSRLTSETVLWCSDFSGSRISGRPFISKTCLVVPTEERLSVVDIRNPNNARTIHFYPTGKWATDKALDREAPGNVVVAQDHVVIANPWNVSIYSDLTSARKKFDLALRANPSDVDARLVFSEQNFNAGDYSQALALLDEAVKVLGGLKDQASPARNRIFADALLFAQRIQTRDPQATDLTAQLFDRVAAAASNPSQQVVYRTARARFHESLAKAGKRESLARAVELYQEILLDNDFRTVTLSPDDTSAPRQAGAIAEDAIRDLIKRGGPEVYAAFEKTAADMLAALTAAGKPDDLMAIAEKYPNASAAPKALMQAATFYEQQDNPRMAVQVLRRLYWKYNSRFSDNTQRLEMAQAMARNYLRSGNFPAAQGRLERAALLSSGAPITTPMLLPDGKLLANGDGKPVKTLTEAVAALDVVTQQRAELLPDVGIPLPPPMVTAEQMAALLKNPLKPKPCLVENPQSVIAGVQHVLKPPSSLVDMNRYDRLVVCSGNRISAYAPGQAQPLWVSDAQLEDPRAAAWLDASRLVIWGGGGLIMLDGDSGKSRWTDNLAALPPVELLTAPIAGSDQPDPNANAAAIDNGVIRVNNGVLRLQGGGFVVQGGGQLVVQGIAQQIQPAQPAAQPADAQRKADAKERVTFLKPLHDRIVLGTDSGRVVAVSLADGHMLWQTRLCNGAGIQRLLASGDFAVGMVSEGTSVVLAVLDTYSGQQVWKKVFSTIPGRFPQNCVLGDDGTLVWTTPNSIAARDLYEPDAPGWDRPGSSNNNSKYAGITQPEQLVVYRQQVLAVCDGGRAVDRRFLRDGSNSGNALEAVEPKSLVPPDPSVRIRQAGSRIYLISNRLYRIHDLEQDTFVKTRVEETLSLLSSEMLLSRNYTLIPAIPAGTDNNNEETTDYRVLCYNRQIVKGGDGKLTESGYLTRIHSFKEPAHVRSWHVGDGGIYYLAGDDKLHFLKGSMNQ